MRIDDMGWMIDDMMGWCATCDDILDDECRDYGHTPLLRSHDVQWVVCPTCRGEGVLRGYEGVYTSDDFAEDPDFADEYMAHRRPCHQCEGNRVVRGLTDAAHERPAVQAYVKEICDMLAVEAQERRMGA